MEVRLSRGLFARQRRERERRDRNKGYGINELLSNKSDTVNVLAPYKLMPDVIPYTEDKRRIPRSCRDCVNANREDEFKGEDEPDLGIGNCFMLSNRNLSHPLRERLFAEILHYWNRGGQPKLFGKAVTAEDLLNYSKFKVNIFSVINSKADEHMKLNGKIPSEFILGTTGTAFKTVILDNKSNLTLDKFVELFGFNRLKAWVQRILLRFGGWMLSKIFTAAFDGVCYHKGTLKLLKAATDSGLPIIYVPLHKSSLDPILLPWVLLTLGISPLPLVMEPRTARQSPFIRNFSTLFGAFGLAQVADQRQGYNQLTNLAAFSYLRLSVLNGNNLQFVVEPHRSRNGKPSAFVTGCDILNTVADMYKRKELEDAFIVPVSLTYEKLPEQKMIEHAQVEPSKGGNAGTLSLSTLLCSSLGFVRVDFSQPIRLRDFRVRHPYSRPSPYNCPGFTVDAKCATVMPARELQFDHEAGSVASLNSLYGEDDPLCEDEEEDIRDNYDEADFSNALTQHVLYDAQKAATFMSTHMVSFLLLKKFRNGTTLENLIEEMGQLSQDIYAKKRDVGFTGDMPMAVQRAIFLLGSSLISLSRNKDGKIWVQPTGTTKSSLVLGYYSSPLVQLFIKEACVSTAILSIVGLSYKAVLHTSYPMKTSEDELTRHALQVAQLMKGEFILNPPCESTDSVIGQTLTEMNDYSYIRMHKKKEFRGLHGFDDDDDDDDDMYDDGSLNLHSFARKSDVAVRVEKIEFINDAETWKYHEFLRSLIVPYLDFYRVGLTVLLKLAKQGKDEAQGGGDALNDTKEEMELRQEILEEVKKLHKTSKQFNAEEIITVDTTRNFLYHMSAMNIIDSWSDDTTKGKRMIYLTDDYANDPSKLRYAIACVMKYITY